MSSVNIKWYIDLIWTLLLSTARFKLHSYPLRLGNFF